jgi:hypothetical protein
MNENAWLHRGFVDDPHRTHGVLTACGWRTAILERFLGLHEGQFAMEQTRGFNFLHRRESMEESRVGRS